MVMQLTLPMTQDLTQAWTQPDEAERLQSVLQWLREAVERTYGPRGQRRISTPEDVAALLLYEMSAYEQEVLRAVLLDTRNQVLRIHDVVRGSVNSAQVRIAEVFREAVRLNATALILAHNHPSGDPTPSSDDIALTRLVVEAGKLLDIEVLDHLVIGGGRYVSLRERHPGIWSNAVP